MPKLFMPKLTLVGAGPGDAELITLKGLRALASADVVLYDALVNETLLEEAPKDAKKIYVGKRCGKHKFSQDEINQMIVDHALNYGHVVRLKGGDSFVFGRGIEEIEYAASFGIPYVVIPGVSSAIAVPAAAGISVTQRGIAESFWVVTATTNRHELSKDLALAAQSSATVVILMGINKLPEIIETYQKQGMGDATIAIIQEGTNLGQSTYIGKMSDADVLVKRHQITPPAVIVVGEVVTHSQRLKDFCQTLKEEIFDGAE